MFTEKELLDIRFSVKASLIEVEKIFDTDLCVDTLVKVREQHKRLIDLLEKVESHL